MTRWLCVLCLLGGMEPVFAQEINRVQTGTDADLHCLAFAGRSGWAISYGTGQLFRSFDKGQTWQNVWQGDSIYFEELNFINENEGFLTGGDQVFFTSDGGVRWSRVGLDSTMSATYIYGAIFTSGDYGVVSAGTFSKPPKRETIKYENGKWRELTKIPKEHFLKFVKYGNAFLGASAAKIYRFAFDFSSAELLYELSSQAIGPIRDIKATNSLIVAVSFSGHTITSYDNGNTWIEHSLSKIPLRSIAFVSELNGLIVGNRSTLYGTTDGAKTWRSITLPDSSDVDLHRVVIREHEFWICGKGGLIYRVRY
jgi:photosystem II stability/assembly factor-like uncharacterized protein